MDARKNMIIAKGVPVTSGIRQCVYNSATGKWNVTYHNGRKFSYIYKNIVWLKNPVSLNPKSFHISCNGKTFKNVTSISVFSDGSSEYWHTVFSNGYEADFNRRDLTVEKSCLDNERSRKIFSYLKETAEIISLKTEDDISILYRQYEKTDFLRENSAAAAYLNPGGYRSGTGLPAEPLIFPFGCNKSQYKAAANAISNHVSVIEGPPGTGKTQTILNIIANLLVRGKTVQIVSNNNSAIENIQEKLSSPKYGLDFFTASLGRVEKKEAFISSQTGVYPDFSSWPENGVTVQQITERGRTLQKIYEFNNRLAELKEEKQTAEAEQKHFLLSCAENLSLDFCSFLPSGLLLKLYQETEAFLSGRQKYGFWGKILFRLRYRFSVKQIISSDSSSLLPGIMKMYYERRLSELESEIEELRQKLEGSDAGFLEKQFSDESLAFFKSYLKKKYGTGKKRTVFKAEDLWRNSSNFLLEYPVVLSTTYTAGSSLGRDGYFDYVIMDEASQVDVVTGALSMTCAENAVIVGDDKQLPNVVTGQQKQILQGIFDKAKIPEAYNFASHSFLESFYSLLEGKIPKTVLSEHYRCDPLIIGYCNQRFYNNQLTVMTQNSQDVLNLVTAVSGNHQREHTNLRQAQIIKQEILPVLDMEHREIGIISPYRNQAALLRQIIDDPDIETDTVHKFQGREKDVIIYCTVDDTVTDFSDNANLINVAVSRAKKKLFVVASEMKQPEGSCTGDLIGYIRYHNGTEIRSNVCSVFDYLYKQNREKRREYLKKHRRISEYDSENLFYALIEEELASREEAVGTACHYPLFLLIKDYSELNEEETRFVKTGLSHLDFLLFNRVTKKPLLAIEVDGYNFHKEGSRQGERDKIKNHILSLYQIPLLRFSTNGSGEKEILHSSLNRIFEKSKKEV